MSLNKSSLNRLKEICERGSIEDFSREVDYVCAFESYIIIETERSDFKRSIQG